MTNRIEVLLPPLGGDDMESATFLEWLVDSGERVAADQVIARVETAKAVVEVVAPAEGYLVRGDAKPADEIPSRSVVAYIARDSYSVPEAAGRRIEDARAQSAGHAASSPPQEQRALRATPSARRLARIRGVDLHQIQTRGATITEADVELHHSGAASRAAYGRSMAKAMMDSLQIPQFSVALDIDGEAIFEARNRWMAQGKKLTVNDVVIKSVAEVLEGFPTLRSCWDGNGAKTAQDVNIAVAITTPYGLTAPVLREANKLGLERISMEIQRLRTLASNRRLSVNDVSGASFTISNLGGAGVDDFTAIVSTGQGAILAVSSFKRRPVPGPDGSVEWRNSARFRVSADHRVITGQDVADFLKALKNVIETRLKL